MPSGRESAHSAGCARRRSGRGDELENASVRSSASTARVTVIAPPGVGKTRLLDELATAAAGAAVLRARLRPDVLSPFEPVAQLVGGTRTPSELAALERAAGATEARAAVVAELLGAVGSAEVHPAAEREQLFAAWLEGLDAIAGERAAVWLVEDVHWASPDLLAFLELAGGSPRAAGRLVVASARPVLLDDRPEWVEGGERLDLPLLPSRETEELVRELVGEPCPRSSSNASPSGRPETRCSSRSCCARGPGSGSSSPTTPAGVSSRPPKRWSSR